MLTAFPVNLMLHQAFPGAEGELVRSVAPLSLQPPYPWATWLYANTLPDLFVRTPGDIAEFGVGLGGMSIALAMLARPDQRVVSIDSFKGLPSPHPVSDNSYFRHGFYDSLPCREPLLDRFITAVDGFGLSETVRPVAAYFDEAVHLPEFADREYAFVHIDGDLYQSVMTALEAVWPRMPEGACLVVDDFFHPAQGPARALSDFMNAHDISPVLHVVFPYSVLIVKGERRATRAPRAVDGQCYSLDLLRSDEHLRAVAAQVPVRPDLENRRTRFLALLEAPTDTEHDVYDYWSCISYFLARLDFTSDGAEGFLL